MPDLDINVLLRQCTEYGASDFHLRVGLPPLMRLHGDIQPVPGYPQLKKDDVERLIGAVLVDEHRKRFYEHKSVDLAYAVPGVARFRVNCFIQQGVMGAVMRRIPERIPHLAELAAPYALLEFARKPRGLVLVTGPTGSGKSTTLAAVIDIINSERSGHILTIEDPIEFVHQPKGCVVNQREVGPDTPSFDRALEDGLREDPDVILVGEMRSFETIAIALRAAETGHLVLGTLHTSSAESTISRVIDVFPADQQQQVRTMLSSSLVGVVCQTLLPRLDGQGRVAAHEVLVANPAIRANIRDNRLPQIRHAMQTGHREGMHTIDKALAYLVTTNTVAEDIAADRAYNRDEFYHTLESMRRGANVAPPRLILAPPTERMGATAGARAMNAAQPPQAAQPTAPASSPAAPAGRKLQMPESSQPMPADRAAGAPVPMSMPPADSQESEDRVRLSHLFNDDDFVPDEG